MPVIPVQSNDWGELSVTVSKLLLNPEDAEAASSLDAELKGNIVAGIADFFGTQNFPVNRAELRLIHSATPARLPTVEQNKTPLRDAHVAGLILKTVLRIACHLPRRASVMQAMKIVSHGFRKGPHPLGISALKPIWARFKPVSHLTGALFLAPKTMLPAAQLIDQLRSLGKGLVIEPIETEFTQQEKIEMAEEVEQLFEPMLEVFRSSIAMHYAVAEKLRMAGQKFFAPGQRVRDLPLLNPDEMWTIPPQFELPPVELDFGPPLTETEISILGKGK